MEVVVVLSTVANHSLDVRIPKWFEPFQPLLTRQHDSVFVDMCNCIFADGRLADVSTFGSCPDASSMLDDTRES
eukprot:2482389-Amphidinium_carterae.2